MPSLLCIPKITVAAIFQKDPQCLIAHPNTGVKTLPDLKGRPIYISAGGSITYWPLLKAKYKFTDAQKRPYNFNPAPFLADKTSAQQGYITSEPLAIEKQGGFKPIVFLLAELFLTTGLGVLMFVSLSIISDSILSKWHESAIRHEN